MDVKAIPALIVGVMVAVVMVGAVLPVFAETTDPDTTFKNDGLWRMKTLENGDTYSLSSAVWSYNGETILSGDIVTNNPNSSVVLGDNWTVRATGGVRGHDIAGNSTNTIVVGDNDEVTFSGSGMAGVTTQTLTGYGADLEGDYIMTAYNTPVYMNGDSPLYATGSSFKNNESLIVHITGNIDDGFTVTAEGMYWPGDPTYSNVVVSDVVVNYSPVNGYEDLYILNNITANISYDMTKNEVTTSGSMSVNYSSYVVPYEVTAEKSVHPDGTLSILINVLPLMAVAGLLLAGVAWFVWKKG